MKILVTGGAGFIGSYVVRELVARGMDVAVVLRPSTAVSRLADTLGRIRVIDGDLGLRESTARALAGFRPEAVIHLAWEGVLGDARNDLAQARNVASSLTLAEEAARAGVQALIGLGSQAEYGPCPDRVDEGTPTRPSTLYGASKLATCIAAQRLAEVAQMRFAWLRLFSSYGPKDATQWMIPYLIVALLHGESPKLTAGAQVWDYLYVEDAARAIVAVALDRSASGVFNLGSGQAFPIRSIAERVRDRIDPKLPLEFGAVPYRADQVMHLEADIGRLREATGWKPEVTIDDGLARTVDWYREREKAH